MRKSKIDTKVTLLLIALDLTHTDIAKSIGRSVSMVSLSLAGYPRTGRTRELITKFIRERITTQGKEAIRIGHDLIDLLTEK